MPHHETAPHPARGVALRFKRPQSIQQEPELTMTDRENTHLIPLAIAVTGHRDIAPFHEESIREALAARLRKFQNQYPHTPLRCLSGLAEGADMLFAQAALDMGLELVAVLPESVESFARDFERPAHPQRDARELAALFRELLSRCSEVVTVPVPEQHGDPSRKYALVGGYLAQHSHVLLSLWDGVESSKVGGTRFVMKQFQEGVANEHRDNPAMKLDAPDPRPVYNLSVPRKDADLSAKYMQWTPHCDAAHAQESDKMLLALEKFNAEADRMNRNEPERRALSEAYIGVDKDTLAPCEKHILGAFVSADALAMHYQKRAHRHTGFIFLTAALMLLAFTTYSNFIPSRNVLGLYVSFFGIGLVAYFIGRKRNYHSKYLDYRGLAEGLRVQLFYRLAGVRLKAASQYLRKQRSEITWIRDAIRTMDIGSRRDEPLFGTVTKHWIEDQRDYFAGAARRNYRTHKRNSRISLLLFIAGLTLAATWLALQPALAVGCGEPELLKWVIALIGLLPAAGATLSGYTFRLGLDQHAKQYARMYEVFARAANHLPKLAPEKRDAQFKLLVEELGREALAENADWILLHRDRPTTWPQ